MTAHEIYALRYAGPLTGSGALTMWFQDWDVVTERAYYFWCLRGGGATVLIDAGVAPDLAAAKGVVNYVNPLEVLAGLGVRAEEVGHLILTHLHWDHLSGAALFPNAVIHVQETEYNFWVKDPLGQNPVIRHFADPAGEAYLAGLEGTERLHLVSGDEDILPGVSCLLAPGHTIGLQVVVVDTARGRAVVGSDCGHTFRNYREEWPSAIIFDLPAWLKTFPRVKAAASDPELVFPGHDILMSREYPQVAPGVTRLA